MHIKSLLPYKYALRVHTHTRAHECTHTHAHRAGCGEGSAAMGWEHTHTLTHVLLLHKQAARGSLKASLCLVSLPRTCGALQLMGPQKTLHDLLTSPGSWGNTVWDRKWKNSPVCHIFYWNNLSTQKITLTMKMHFLWIRQDLFLTIELIHFETREVGCLV